MQHKLLEAKATTTTELGEFEAIAAAYSVDRMNERITPGAFKGTIAAWSDSGKQIPLHWDHSAEAKDIIGQIDPKSLRETENGLEVKGKLDLEDSDVAREAWRSMKAGRVGLSFGYMVTEDATGADGVRELKALDLFEITVTPAPANPDTRFIGFKSVKEMDSAELKKAIAELRARLEEVDERATELTEPPAVEVEDRETRSPDGGQDERQDPQISPMRALVLRAQRDALMP